MHNTPWTNTPWSLKIAQGICMNERRSGTVRATGSLRQLACSTCFRSIRMLLKCPGTGKQKQKNAFKENQKHTNSIPIPASRRPGIPASRRPGIPASRHPGVPASRRPGIPPRHPGISILTSPYELSAYMRLRAYPRILSKRYPALPRMYAYTYA